MFASHLIRETRTFCTAKHLGLHDRVDRINTLFTPLLLAVCTTLVTTATYYLRPLSCIATSNFEGQKSREYIQSYCLVHGTVPAGLRGVTEPVPQSLGDWQRVDAEHRMTYYQLMPLFLLALAVLCSLPQLVWQAVCHNRVGLDFVLIVSQVNAAAQPHKSTEVAGKEVAGAARGLFDMLCHQRARLDFHKMCAAVQASRWSRMKAAVLDTLFFHRSLNRALVVGYVLFKALLLLLAVVTVFLLARFLNYRRAFFPGLAADLLAELTTAGGGDRGLAVQTGWFPRVAFCLVQFRSLGVNNNHIVAQCSLTINMINEKVCVLLALWFSVLSAVNVASLVGWTASFVRRESRADFVRTMLFKNHNFFRLKSHYTDIAMLAIIEKEKMDPRSDEKKSPVDDLSSQDELTARRLSLAQRMAERNMANDLKYLDKFIFNFLKQDGVFVLRMTKSQVDTFMTSHLVLELWKLFCQERERRHNNADTVPDLLNVFDYCGDDDDLEKLCNDLEMTKQFI